MDKEKAKDKIRKLLNKANGTSNREEAMNFTAKAAEWMAQWDIEESELGIGTVHRIDRSQFTIKYLNPWRRAIIGELGQMCSCYVVFIRSTNIAEVYGTAEKRAILEELFFDLEKQVVLISRSLFPKDHTSARRAEAGLGIQVASKIKESWQYQNKEVHGLKALVVRDQAQGEELARSLWGDIREGRPIKFSATSEFIVGANAIDMVDIHKGVKA